MPTMQEPKLEAQFGPRPRSGLMLIGWLAICLVVAFHSMVCSWHGLPVWYAGLIKPPLNPPGYLFAVAWSVLAVLAAFAVWIVWKTRPSPCRYRGIRLFWAQLLLGFLWTWVFFARHQLLTSLVDVLALVAALLLLILNFKKMSVLAAWLMVPSLAWAAYLGYLNLALWRLNP
jgi:translocator protein